MSAELAFWSLLALKMVLTAIVVVVTSLVVERSGPFVGALVGALPTSAGAAYVILALEQPPDFIAASAIGSVAVNGAIAIFAAAYAMLAQRAACSSASVRRPRCGSRSRPCCARSIGRRSAPWRSRSRSTPSPSR
jgi:uncharacterized membrane protein (GlpM family)